MLMALVSAVVGLAMSVQPAADAKGLLAACEAKYAQARTYRDTAEVTNVMYLATGDVTSRMPAGTAFEREGRFLWFFRHSAMPGAQPDQVYTVSSADQASFESAWTLTGRRDRHESLSLALAGPTGISSGAAMAITPLLRPDVKWGWTCTDLEDPVELREKEKVGGVECAVITGHRRPAQTITLWIGPDSLIRRIRTEEEIDPALVTGDRNAHKFRTTTTIELNPVLDGDLAADAFTAPAR